MRLRIVPPASADTGCLGCSRRAILQGFAMTAATALVGCQTDDTVILPDPGPVLPGVMCGSNLCLELDDPLYAALTEAGGSLLVSAPGDRVLIVVRTSASEARAVSDICTHLRCNLRYDRANSVLACPCHGSQYTLTGEVIRGPSVQPLARYQTQLDLSANLLTIFL